MDPVREAERILRGERRGRGWMILGATVVVLGLLVVAQVAPSPARPVRTGTAVAVLRSGDSSQWCAEGVADVSGHVWSTISDRVDQVRLPLRGKLRIVDGANAVFTAHRVKLALSPAMPCTPG